MSAALSVRLSPGTPKRAPPGPLQRLVESRSSPHFTSGTSERAAARPALTSPKRAAVTREAPAALEPVSFPEWPPPHRGPLGLPHSASGRVLHLSPFTQLTAPLHSRFFNRRWDQLSLHLTLFWHKEAQVDQLNSPRVAGGFPPHPGWGIRGIWPRRWVIRPRRLLGSAHHQERLRDSALRRRSNRPATGAVLTPRVRWR